MRLGDLDALKEEVKTLFCPDGYKIMMLERIDNAPTVDTIPKGDLISREALREALNEMFDTVEVMLFDDIIATIDNAPTVDIKDEIAGAYNEGYKCGNKEAEKARPQGEWIRTGSLGNGNAHYECSNCHHGDEHAESQEVPYCWYCGAKMRKGGKEE